jgi:hypothetical protein
VTKPAESTYVRPEVSRNDSFWRTPVISRKTASCGFHSPAPKKTPPVGRASGAFLGNCERVVLHRSRAGCWRAPVKDQPSF